MGQDSLRTMTAMGPEADVALLHRHVRSSPGSRHSLVRSVCPLSADIVAKVFWDGEQKFLEPLMRLTRGDVRDRMVSSKIDHGPSPWR